MDTAGDVKPDVAVATTMLATLQEVCDSTSDNIAIAKAAVDDFLPAPPQPQAPQTFAEALQLVQAREDEKKKKDSRKEGKNAKKAAGTPQEHFPGAVAGGEPDKSAFWMVMEDYFRDVTQEDLHFLLPTYTNVLEDPAFYVPPLGQHYTAVEQARSAGEAGPDKLDQPSGLEKEDPGTADATPEAAATVGDESDKTGGRRSRRLGAKLDWKARFSNVDDLVGAIDPEGLLSAAGEQNSVTPLLEAVCSCDMHLAVLIKQVLALQGGSLEDLARAAGASMVEVQQWLACSTNGMPQKGSVFMPCPASLRQSLPAWAAQQAAVLLGKPRGTAAASSLPSLGRQLGPDEGGDSALPTAAGLLDPFSLGEAELAAAAAGTQSWTQLQQALLQVQRRPPPRPPPPDEFLHPHTLLALRRPLGSHVFQQGSLRTDLGTMSSRPGGSGGASPCVTPSASQDGGAFAAAAGDAELAATDTATTDAAAPDAAAAARKQVATPAGAAADPCAAERQGSGQPVSPRSSTLLRQRSSVNYSLLAGKHKKGASPSLLGGPGKPASAPPAVPASRKTAKSGAAPAGSAHLRDAGAPRAVTATAVAVAAAAAAAPAEGDLEEQWRRLAAAREALAAAPDDEILSEMLMLQIELLQQVAVNRTRLGVVLASLLEQLPAQQECARQRAAAEIFVKSYIAKIRAEKRIAKRAAREAAQREAQAAAEAQIAASPRTASGRPGSRSANKLAYTPLAEDSHPAQGVRDMVDALASRDEDEEAVCAVCAGGLSVPPNEIVFCERCDLAVHQACYDVTPLPPGEWLCWPCARHEADLRRYGMPQLQIRPPRFMAMPPQQQALEGGSRGVTCALCPVRHGAFRLTTDGREWVHQVCAAWHPEVTVLQQPIAEVVEGKANIKADRWGVTCGVCGASAGAVIRCNYGHCAAAYHPLCGRNNGQLFTLKPSATRSVQRSYCAAHSDVVRSKTDGRPEALDGVPAAAGGAAGIRASAEQVAALEDSHARLGMVRLELEQLRLLCERIHKRERLKREALRHSCTLHLARMADPLPGCSAAFSATRVAQAAAGAPPPVPEQQRPLPGRGQPGALPHGPAAPAGEAAEDAATAGPSRQRQPDPGSQVARRKHTREPEDDPGGGGKRARTGAAPPHLPRQCDMTSAEARAANTGLPPGFQFVPADQLPAGSKPGQKR